MNSLFSCLAPLEPLLPLQVLLHMLLPLTQLLVVTLRHI
jgi:hypothetical protein